MKIKRFIDCFVPITNCTLRCEYCYITQHRLFEKSDVKLNFSPSLVAKALSKERMGGVCLINFCAGGETLLLEDVVAYIKALLEEGHYVMVVTNATISKRFDELAKFPKELLDRLFFKFSYHYLELKSRNLLDTFFNNIVKVWDAGASFTLEVTPHDELIPYIDEMNDLAIKRVGARPHITIARDERKEDKLPILTSLTRKDYYKTWGVNRSEFFDFKQTIFEVPRKEFCYAGAWSFYLNLGTGVMTQCYKSVISQNIFANISKPINFTPIGCNCQEHHCYNGHVWLSLGDIPELDTPTYATLRNRKTTFGKDWLTPTMNAFMSTKLCDSNLQLTPMEKSKIDKRIKSKISRKALKRRVRQKIKSIKRLFKG